MNQDQLWPRLLSSPGIPAPWGSDWAEIGLYTVVPGSDREHIGTDREHLASGRKDFVIGGNNSAPGRVHFRTGG